MKNRILNTSLIVTFFLSCACSGPGQQEDTGVHSDHDHNSQGHEHEEEMTVHLSAKQFRGLGMELTSTRREKLSHTVEASGELEVPPQNHAMVTAIVSSNIQAINIIEGDKVEKGQVLAYLSHPNLFDLQSRYLTAFNDYNFLKSENERQEKLHKAEVSSGKSYDATRSKFLSKQGELKALEAQIKMLGLNPVEIQNGSILDKVPVKSPIKGHIQNVNVRLAQHVTAETELFEIINLDDVHADLMVFEKDIRYVKKGQKVRFSTEAVSGKMLDATIYSVGKSFEHDPKAVHIHAEIDKKEGLLIPGMYIKGIIMTGTEEVLTLPTDAVIREGDKSYAFVLESEPDDDDGEWTFRAVELATGLESSQLVEVRFSENNYESAQFAANSSYYLMAELKKGEGGHSH